MKVPDKSQKIQAINIVLDGVEHKDVPITKAYIFSDSCVVVEMAGMKHDFANQASYDQSFSCNAGNLKFSTELEDAHHASQTMLARHPERRVKKLLIDIGDEVNKSVFVTDDKTKKLERLVVLHQKKVAGTKDLYETFCRISWRVAIGKPIALKVEEQRVYDDANDMLEAFSNFGMSGGMSDE